MILADRLIVLHATKTGERSLVLQCLSRRMGRRSFLVSPGSRTPQAFFLPLSLLDVEIIENPHSDLWRIRSLAAESPLSGIRSNPAKNALTLFMSEVLFRLMRDGTGDAAFFDNCRKHILTLDSLEDNFASFHLWFLLDLCRELGFAPGPESIAPFAGERRQQLSALCGADEASVLLYPLKGEDRSAIATVLLNYLGYHAECHLELRSLAVLREIFA